MSHSKSILSILIITILVLLTACASLGSVVTNSDGDVSVRKLQLTPYSTDYWTTGMIFLQRLTDKNLPTLAPSYELQLDITQALSNPTQLRFTTDQDSLVFAINSISSTVYGIYYTYHYNTSVFNENDVKRLTTLIANAANLTVSVVATAAKVVSNAKDDSFSLDVVQPNGKNDGYKIFIYTPQQLQQLQKVLQKGF